MTVEQLKALAAQRAKIRQVWLSLSLTGLQRPLCVALRLWIIAAALTASLTREQAIDAFNEEPTETELMQEAIETISAYVARGSSGVGGEVNTEEIGVIENNLKGLKILVEPIDNANGDKHWSTVLSIILLRPIAALSLFRHG